MESAPQTGARGRAARSFRAAIEYLLNRPREVKRALQMIADFFGVGLAVAVVVSFHTGLLPLVVVGLGLVYAFIAVVALRTLSLYRAMVRYFAPSSTVIVVVFSFVLAGVTTGFLAITGEAVRLRFLVDLALGISFALLIPRLLLRLAYEKLRDSAKRPVAIYGAGEAGRQLAAALQAGRDFRIAGFVDDKPSLWGTRILGLPVNAPHEFPRLCPRWQIENILLAMPTITHSRRRQILKTLAPLPVKVQTIPGMADLVAGRANVNQLRTLEIEDLLGRDSVPPVTRLIEHDTRSRRVMVTGAGGSIGAELVRTILAQRPACLVLFDIAEYSLYAIEREVQEACQLWGVEERPEVIPILGSVCDERLLERVVSENRIETVYHAAAYKHVPLVEANHESAMRNNIWGTWRCAEVALKAGVESFVLVSTDKAVRPTSLMGASKRIAELGVQALAKLGGRTRFSIVRFGNVLGSSGSVVPHFRRQIERGGPVTITHRDMVRYFMTIGEAAQLVIQAGAQGERGEVFVLDMGEPVRIYDLASSMIRLSGLEVRDAAHPDGDIAIIEVGLRPGEKLYEELLLNGSQEPTAHPRISRCDEPSVSVVAYRDWLERIEQALEAGSLTELLADLPIEYAGVGKGDRPAPEGLGRAV